MIRSGDTAPLKGAPRELLYPLNHIGCQKEKEMTITRHPIGQHLDLRRLAFTNIRILFCCLKTTQSGVFCHTSLNCLTQHACLCIPWTEM